MIRINTNHGAIELELYADKAPVTVENFLRYAREGFFNGTLFHRVIDGFMIQGGGMEPGMSDKRGGYAPIKNEADNGLKNERGTIAMARTNDPHSATSQFFINVANNQFLNFRAPSRDSWGYCVFGKVINGMEVVDKIKGVPTTTRSFHQDVPVEDVIIESVEMVES